MKRGLFLCVALCACGDGPSAPSDGPLAEADGQTLHAAVFMSPVPPVRGVDTARIVLSGAPTGGLEVTVTPWMPQHAHGSSVLPDVQRADDGAFDVSDLYLPMSGTWQLRIHVSGSSTDDLTPTFDVP